MSKTIVPHVGQSVEIFSYYYFSHKYVHSFVFIVILFLLIFISCFIDTQFTFFLFKYFHLSLVLFFYFLFLFQRSYCIFYYVLVNSIYTIVIILVIFVWKLSNYIAIITGPLSRHSWRVALSHKVIHCKNMYAFFF